MIQQAQIRQIILSRLEAYTGCKCVPANTTKNMPAYPYISFNVINTVTHKGTYSRDYETGQLFTELLQIWSFTVQSDSDAEAQDKALLILDFFEESGRLELTDNGVIVANVGAIVPRDNLITIEYEYRKGLDVTIRLNNVIVDNMLEVINEVTITGNNETIDIEKERNE